MKLAHISDLHLSSAHFVIGWGETVTEMINATSPDIVVVTGDLTDDGYEYEYEIAKRYLERIEAKNMIVVPGNHDARNEGYKLFDDMFGTRFPYYEDDSIIVLGIDSSEPDIDDGHIGREHYGYIESKLMTGRGKLKILALHHHLIPIPGTGRERDIPVDAGDVLKLCTESDVDLIFSGHKHMSWIWKLENTYFVTVGTSTTRRLKGKSYPSFNLLMIEEDRLLLREVNVVNRAMKDILVLKSKNGP